ncbi:M48 family metalloprotease [Acetohalobium arabaticum]|uniref:Peptidase M48 Ste24p n=1 Tax=Acetohalobium arabaticum (strain ATCC 49924 / DSM 5501 / Z-7288) TaxID=574087 RepID=D9QQG7_ACEAZ|nr:M48 family metalloprotease [Acetohalobium arabaticum]ADL12758.1 peptidase M48 Ste24p [Acetohalobium arabaticum DSM 5501]
MEELYDPKRRRLAKEYNRIKDRYNKYEIVLRVLFWGIFFGLSLEVRLYHFIADMIGNFDLKLIGFLLGITFLYSIYNWIFDYLLSYRLNRTYELSNQTPKEWLIDKVKVFILTNFFLYIAGRVFLTITIWYPDRWWLPFSIGGIFFILVINFVFPVVLLPLFFELTPYPESSLRERLMELFARAGVEVADIYEFNLSSKMNSANAAVIGMGKTRKIILGDNLQDRYTNDEIEAVLAHEVGHHANGDMFELLAVEALSLLITVFLVSKFWQPLTGLFGYMEAYSIISLPLFFLMLGILNWLISPLELIFSRQTERKADNFALELIDNPHDLATAFAKLADDSLAKLEYNWYELLFKASHPPINERVEKALYWSDRGN